MAALIVLLAPASCTKSPRTSPGTQPGSQTGMTSSQTNQALPTAAWLSGIFPTGSPAASAPATGAGAVTPGGTVTPAGAVTPAGTVTPAGAAMPAETATPAGTVPGAGSPKQTIAVAGEEAVPAAAVVPRQNTDVTSLLTLGRDSRILPEDFKIGQMGDARAGDSDERQAMTAAASFLGRLVAGKVDAALLDPGSENRVSDMLDFGIQRGDVPRSYRLGAPKKHESGEITASLRLFGPVGTSEGEISLARTGEHWLVTDLQISMDDLQVKQEKPKERFFPSSYRWMLEE